MPNTRAGTDFWRQTSLADNIDKPDQLQAETTKGGNSIIFSAREITPPVLPLAVEEGTQSGFVPESQYIELSLEPETQEEQTKDDSPIEAQPTEREGLGKSRSARKARPHEERQSEDYQAIIGQAAIGRPTEEQTDEQQTTKVKRLPEDKDDISPTEEIKQIRTNTGNDPIEATPLDSINGVNTQEIPAAVEKAKMDHTQHSSFSPTQENPESAYKHFKMQLSMAKVSSDDSHSDNETDEDNGTRSDNFQYHNETGSTLRTYGENDTGHVNLDNLLEEPVEGDTQIASQDASFEPRAVLLNSYEPQTPAPPVNPFKNQGTVLKAADLFAATQPSPAFHKGPSPASSSRPTPGMYDNLQTPQQYMQSPSKRRIGGTGSSPLRSDVKRLMNAVSLGSSDKSSISRVAGVRSFSSGPAGQLSSPIPQPRKVYTSMKESQERRRASSKSLPEPNSDEDSDLDDLPRRRLRRRQLDQKIQVELSAVQLRHGTRSVRSIPSSNDAIQVPSTRARSLSEEYIMQSEGRDARDAQDEVIGNSQPESTSDDPLPTLKTKHLNAAIARGKTGNQPPKLEAQTRSTETIPVSDAATSSPHPPSLPLQQLPTSRRNLRTPAANKNIISSDGADVMPEVIPETSPINDRLKPMTEIAGLSFSSRADQDFLNDVPGFTPDQKSARVLAMRSSQQSAGSQAQERPISEAAELSKANTAPRFLSSLHIPEQISTSPLSDLSPMSRLDEKEAGIFSGTKRESAKASIELEQELPTARRQTLRPKDQQSSAPSVVDVAGATPKPPTTAVMSRVHESVTSNAVTTGSELTTTTNSAVNTPNSSIRESRPTSVFLTPSKAPSKQTYKTKRRTLKDDTPARSIAPVGVKRGANRKSAPGSIPDGEKTGHVVTRAFKRQTRSMSMDVRSSPAPLAPLPYTGLFGNMAFAISFVDIKQHSIDDTTKSIIARGGHILKGGFDELFKGASITQSRTQTNEDLPELALNPKASTTGFTALIADKHSRKVKYMQALALGIPCISLRWTQACVDMDVVLDWEPYLLCAGQSSFLYNAPKSRSLRPYAAINARFAQVYNERAKLFEDKSILVVTGKGQAAQARRAHLFLTRALGPARVGQVTDLEQARTKLSQAEKDGEAWDMLFVADAASKAETILFGTAPSTAAGGLRKRKKNYVDDDATGVELVPRNIRIVCDEDVVQSLILGQLVPTQA